MEKETIDGLQHPVQYVRDKTSFALQVQNALGFAMPPVIPVRQRPVAGKMARGTMTVEETETAKRGQAFSVNNSTYWQCPVTLKAGGKVMLLPVDPIIGVAGKNIITRRYVAKGKLRGSIKEWWSLDDWDITMAGVMMEDGFSTTGDYVIELRDILETAGSVEIVNEVINNVYGVRHMAVESYDFPPTKGMENQAFSIKGYSDEGYSLLL